MRLTNLCAELQTAKARKLVFCEGGKIQVCTLHGCLRKKGVSVCVWGGILGTVRGEYFFWSKAHCNFQNSFISFAAPWLSEPSSERSAESLRPGEEAETSPCLG